MQGVVTHRQAAVSSASELGDLVVSAAAEGTPVIDYGIAHQGLGSPPARAGITPAWTVASSGIIEHYLPDMTVRAAAGATLGSVQRTLAASNQFIPFDADDDLTIGEIITHNVYGPLRSSFGGPRDLLLGLRYIDGLGREIAVGGRTVKNVAGYDVTRFMVGSLNELGLLTEATIRTYAIPSHVITARLSISSLSVLRAWGTAWLVSDAAPGAASLTYQPGGEWELQASYFGRAEACEAQLDALRRLIKEQPGLSLTGTQEDSFADYAVRAATARAWRRKAAALVKIVVPPAALGGALDSLASLGLPASVDALPMHGCAWVGGELTAEAALQLHERWVAPAIASAGVYAWYARPAEAASIPAMGPEQADQSLLKRIKSTMDPHGIFNPGRFPSTEDPAK